MRLLLRLLGWTQEFDDNVHPLLKRISLLLDKHSRLLQEAHEKTAEGIKSIAISYHNDADEYIVSEKLLRYGLSLITPFRDESILYSRICEDLKTVASHACFEKRDKILHNLENALKISANNLSFKRKACEKALEDYRTILQPSIKGIEDLLKDSLEILRNVRECVAGCLRSISISFYNEVDEKEKALQLLNEVESMMSSYSGSEIYNKVKEDIITISGNVRYAKTIQGLNPVGSAPTLYTLNGIGTKLYGNSDYDSETRSYMTNLYFVILFIPILPIARYRVIEEGRGYRFIGKAPFRDAERWHLGIVLALFGIMWLSSFLSGLASNSNSRSTTGSSASKGVTDQQTSQPSGNSGSTGGFYGSSSKEDKIRDLKDKVQERKGWIKQKESDIESLDTEISSEETQLDSMKQQLESLELDVRLGNYVDETYYSNLVEEHNTLANTYNYKLAKREAMYRDYKALLEKTNTLINEYNTLSKQ